MPAVPAHPGRFRHLLPLPLSARLHSNLCKLRLVLANIYLSPDQLEVAPVIRSAALEFLVVILKHCSKPVTNLVSFRRSPIHS